MNKQGWSNAIYWTKVDSKGNFYGMTTVPAMGFLPYPEVRKRVIALSNSNSASEALRESNLQHFRKEIALINVNIL